MTFKGHAGIRFVHSLSIVDYLNACSARIGEQDAYDRSTSVNGVFHQFLDNGSRALDDFASRNLVGDGVGEKMYQITHDRSFYCRRNLQMMMSPIMSRMNAKGER